jgi:hypothetical protein
MKIMVKSQPNKKKPQQAQQGPTGPNQVPIKHCSQQQGSSWESTKEK